MRIPKRYGQSKKNDCPFCGKIAILNNPQGVPVCAAHKNAEINNFKCVCGDWLDLFKGKWGPYFRCFKCGNMSYSKAMDINRNLFDIHPTAEISKTPAVVKSGVKAAMNRFIKSPPSKLNYVKSKQTSNSTGKKEIVIRSDELDFWC